MTRASVVLIDDHAVVRQGLNSLLSTTPDFNVVGEASEGAGAIEAVHKLKPDIAIVDLLIPGINGVAAIREIRKSSPYTIVAVLTSSEDVEFALASIEAGAHAFFLKSMSGDELLAGLRRLSHDDVVVPTIIARHLRHAASHTATRPRDPFAELTERELEVLRALANGASNARLAQELMISEKTVKSHIGNILAKLKLSDRTEAVAFAWRNGLMKVTK